MCELTIILNKTKDAAIVSEPRRYSKLFFFTQTILCSSLSAMGSGNPFGFGQEGRWSVVAATFELFSRVCGLAGELLSHALSYPVSLTARCLCLSCLLTSMHGHAMSAAKSSSRAHRGPSPPKRRTWRQHDGFILEQQAFVRLSFHFLLNNFDV
jgi:hypothetical protein